MNRRDKSTMMKGIAIGLVAGAFIPDQFNPYIVVRRLLAGG
jgi:small basic protein